MDDLSYDELQYEEAPSATGQLLNGVVVLLIAVLGAPQVWELLQSRQFGPALVYYPVLGGALGYLAVRGRRP